MNGPRATFRDLAALPFLFLHLFFMWLAIEVGGPWTSDVLSQGHDIMKS